MRNDLVALLLLLLAAACGKDQEPPAPTRADAEAAMRRGIGLLESFRYAEARTELLRAVEAAPDWIEAKVNAAIALMNLTSDEKAAQNPADTAIRLLEEVVAKEPKNPYARFTLGVLLIHNRGEAELGLAQLLAVQEPDAATHVWIGRAQRELKDYEGALRSYEQAIEMDRHLAAAYYGRFLCLSLLGRREQAQEVKKQWQRVRPAEQANLITAKAYHEIGKYSLVVRHYPDRPAPPRSFDWETRVIEGYELAGARAAVGLGDIDGDGDLDLYLPGALLVNEGGLAFRTAQKLSGQPGLFFDFDGDQLLDLFCYGAKDQLFRGSGDGSFLEVTDQAGLGGTPRRSRFALAADLDMDGDVDLFVTEDSAPDRLLSNKRDGSFHEVLIGNSAASRGALTIDFDRDQDPDLLVARAEGAPVRFRNDRADGFAPMGAAPLPPGTGLVAGDLDRDGHEEVRSISSPLLFVDVDLDGALDEVALPGVLCATAADLDGDGAPEIVALREDGRATLRKARVEPGHWIAFDLRGRKAPAPPQWAAPVGPGATVEVLAKNLWQLRVSRSVSGFGGQHSPWISFGLGEHERVDIVRIVWPDRVLQAELDLPADRLKVIREVNRKPSSCPLLFVDGPDGPRFVTDFLGSGGLGFYLERGVYGKPDPDEVVALGPLEPVNGSYVLRILEPLEEISYLDEATLLAVDHPAGVELLANERFAGEEPFPEFRFWEIERRTTPVRAWNDRGDEVLERLARVDRNYPPVPLDGRFEGFAKPHWLALDFRGRVPSLEQGERLVLILDGWVEYGYSHSNFAAAQAGLALSPPVLERLEDGAWRLAMANTGYPAGLSRTMTVDVTGVVTPAHPVFRLRTNLEIYWDRIALGIDRGGFGARVHRVVPAEAHLHDRGYPREYSPDGSLPLLYDYGLMDPGYPFKTMSGDYTRLGEVSPLLRLPDDCFVIFGKGEELTLHYPVSSLPPLGAGRKRTFFLYAVGFCKDMDPYTAHPDTVEPLPFRAMSNYPYPAGEHYPDTKLHREYRAAYNTRRVARRR